MLTARKIWNGLKDNRWFDMPDPMKKIWRQIIEKMLDSYSSKLSVPASTRSICDMRIAFLDVIVNEDYIRRIVNAMPALTSGDRNIDMITLTDLITTQREKWISWTFLTILARRDQFVEEKLYMLGKDVALNAAARRAYEKGELTIGKLLELQPQVLIPDYRFRC